MTRETKRKLLEMTRTFTADQVMKAIKRFRNSKAFGHNKLSIFHLKHLGPRSIEYITTLFNLSVTTCQIPAIWKSSLVIPIPKPVLQEQSKHLEKSTSASRKAPSCHHHFSAFTFLTCRDRHI